MFSGVIAMRPFNRSAFPAIILALAPPHFALADACRDKIAAMFFGGPLDPGQRPPHRQVVTTVDASGAVIFQLEALWETQDRTLTISGGNYLIAIDGDSWMAQSADGPWQKTPTSMLANRAELGRVQRTQQVANMTDTQCPGTFQIDGLPVEKYVYRIKTDPDATGMYFGSLDTAYVDPATNQVVRWDAAESIASWAPAPANEVQISQLFYDRAIRITAPE